MITTPRKPRNPPTSQQILAAAAGLRKEDLADVFTRGTEVRFTEDPKGEYTATVLGPHGDAGFAVGWIDADGLHVDTFLPTQIVTGTRDATEWVVTEDSRVSLASSGPTLLQRGHRVFDAGTARQLSDAGVKLRAVS